MTNFEKHKERLLKIADSMDAGIAVCNGVPYSCEDAPCENCQFYEIEKNCTVSFIKWLYEEYEEKPKLSERAYHFLKSLPNNVKIKNSGKRLYMKAGESIENTYYRYNRFIPLLPLEPDLWYEVSELLKWDVKDD